MKTYKFSIIIPIYNVENYLRKCLDSVASQTYNNFEVIIVIDKCDDNSEKIADKYIKKYGWTKIYEEHTGLAKARNIGIQKATGDYIVLLDSDDYLENNFLETINKALNDKPDILRFQVRDIINDKKIDRHEIGFDSTKGTEAFNKIIRYHYIENAWAYVYKRDYFIKNKFKYMENCIAEDYGLTPLVIVKAKSVKSISYIGYNYVQRDNSLMNNNDYPKKIKKMDDMLKQSDYEKEQIKNIGNIESVLRFLDNSLIYYSTTLKYKDYKKYNKILKKKGCYKHPIENGLKSKVRSIIIKTNSYLFYNYLVR